MTTTTDWRSLTPADIATMPLLDARALYAPVRDDLAAEYSTTAGPRAIRNLLYRADKLDVAGGRHVEQAARLRAEAEERDRDYDCAVFTKRLLAVRCGHYDSAILDGDSGSDGAEGRTDALRAVEAVRRAELLADHAAVARIHDERSAVEAATRTHHQQLLDCPPVGWGTRYAAQTDRVQAWRARPADDRLRDPRPRECEEVSRG